MEAGTRSKTGKVYNESVYVRCGKCYNCRITRLREWIFRLKQTYKYASNGYFVTLTYDNENVPISQNHFMTLNYRDVQLFLKRLRKKHDNQNIKYYVIGEYGTKRERPHYHMLIFNVQIEKLVKTWNLGEVHFGTVTDQSIAYTLEYMTIVSKVGKHKRDDRVKEFSKMSKNIGIEYITQNTIKKHTESYENMYIQIEDNSKIGLPKYYREKMLSDEILVKQVKIAQKHAKDLHNKRLLEEGPGYDIQEIKTRLRKLFNTQTKKD